MTIMEERARLEKTRWDGAVCRACDQDVKVYTYTLNLMRVGELVRLSQHARHHGVNAYAHVREFVTFQQGGHYAKMRFWGLIEEAPPRKGAITNGCWRLTDAGHAFVRGTDQVWDRMRVFLNRSFGPPEDGKRVWIQTILDGKKTSADYHRHHEEIKMWMSEIEPQEGACA